VESSVERDRAMTLARETDGVTKVIDDLHTR
jgi:osmotically-inducible protein OsmY